MKVSLEWLREYSDINVSNKEYRDILTMTGSKVEGIEEKGNDIKNVVIGKILEITKHPDADKLVVTKVDLAEQKIQIVTGAPNIKVGDIVPVAKDGSTLPGGISIKKGMLRGVESCGMMCSIGELELSKEEYPNQVEYGIMILDKEYEKHLGKDIVDVLNLKEDIVEFEITPNRPDCFSVEGLGRETAISLGKEFKNPHKNLEELKIEDKEEIEGLCVEIKDPDLCYRYIARVVNDVKIGPSPDWMVRRLKAAGVRSINNIVDITNYVMLEMGQPMHAFDINSIDGKHIVVRRANKDEKITTLDETERTLDEEMLVIADQNKPVAVAGVMGGQNSEIEENTKTVVFESAVFYGGSVRKTAKRLGLRTEASSRYEKGLSSENALRAVNRACELVTLLNAGIVIDGKVDNYPTKQIRNTIKINENRINKLLGTTISKQEMIAILEKLEMKVEENTVLVPYFRPDLEKEADIAEEVLRFYGYDKLETTLIDGKTTLGVKTKKQKLEDCLKEFMVVKGFSEIYAFSFINEKDIEKINLSENNSLREEIIKVENPLSEDYTLMRPETISSMMQMLTNNINKKNKDVNLFELSRKYRNKNGSIEKKEIPMEPTMLTIGTYGQNADFYKVKGFVENILELADIARYDIVREDQNESYHPGKTAKAKVGNDVIAIFGEINPIVIDNYGINEKIYIAEIKIDKLTKYGKSKKGYKEIARYPAVERDLAIIVEEDVEVGQIEEIINKKAKKLLEELKLFDVYRSEKLGENKKSVAYSLKFRLFDRTLTDEEVNKAMELILKELELSLDAKLRS